MAKVPDAFSRLLQNDPLDEEEADPSRKLPTTYAEALDWLDLYGAPEVRHALRTEKHHTPEVAAITWHSSYGRWLRNNWGLWHTVSPLRESMQSEFAHLCVEGVLHPDTASNNILIGWTRRLRARAP